MLVSRFYGLGVLSSIAHKIFIEYLITAEIQIERRNPVDLIFNAFGAFFNQQQQNNPLNPANGKWIDHLLPYLCFGTAFASPGASMAVGCLHIVFKLMEIETKGKEINLIKKQSQLHYIWTGKFILAGLTIIALISPLFAQQVQKVK